MPVDAGDHEVRPRLVLLGETLVPASEARISPFDRGFLFGVGVIVTPQVGAFRGILPGTMRALAIESAIAADIPVECRPLSVSEFLRADEIAITSSRRILHSISAIDGRSLPGGRVFASLFDRMIASIATAVAGEPTAAAR